MKMFEDGNWYYTDVNGETTLIGRYHKDVAKIVSGTDERHQFTWPAIYRMVINAALKTSNAKAYYIICGVFDDHMTDEEVMGEMTRTKNALPAYLIGVGFNIAYIPTASIKFAKTMTYKIHVSINNFH